MILTYSTNLRTLKTRRGASAVEFAIVAPVFFLVVLGIIEFGRMGMVQQMLTNASREGCRIAVLDNSTSAGVRTKVNQYLSSGRISGFTVRVTPDPPSTAGFGQSVSVVVSVPFNRVSWLRAPFFLRGRTLQAETIMRRETVE